MRPTPETDAMEWNDPMCNPAKVVESDFARRLERERDDARHKMQFFHDQENRILAMMKERDDLQAWKDSAMALEREWSEQDVGKELGMVLGTAIRPNILPGIRRLKEQARELADALEKAIAELERNTQEIDSYGEPGSNFRICSYCESESGAGMLDKGIPHGPECMIAQMQATLAKYKEAK